MIQKNYVIFYVVAIYDLFFLAWVHHFIATQAFFDNFLVWNLWWILLKHGLGYCVNVYIHPKPFSDVLIEAIVFYWVAVTVTHHHFDKDVYGFVDGLECFLQSSMVYYEIHLHDKETVLFIKCRLLLDLEPRWNLQLKFISYKRFVFSTEDERYYETFNISKVIYESYKKISIS